MNHFSAIPGGYRSRQVRVADRRFDLTVPAEPEEVLCDYAMTERPNEDPYWAHLWTAAGEMAEFVLRRSWPQGATCLELGCGIGLVGLSALAAGLQVTFSDKDERAVTLASLNATENGFPIHDAEVIDWQASQLKPFDVILASDVVYDSLQHAPLLDFLGGDSGRHGRQDARIWMGDPGRSQAGEFLQLAETKGWRVQLLDKYGDRQSSITSGQFVVMELQPAARMPRR